MSVHRYSECIIEIAAIVQAWIVPACAIALLIDLVRLAFAL